MNSEFNWKPVQFFEQWCYVAELIGAMDHPSCPVHNALEFVGLTFREAEKEGIAVVDLGRY